MEWEIIRTVVTSWPLWTAVVAIVFIVVLRSSLADLIRRVRGIGPSGLTAAPQDQKSPAVTDPRKAADELLASLDNQYVLTQEEIIKKELVARGLADDSPETVRVLTRYTAAALVVADLERIDSTIWGSQIDILTFLNSREKASKSELLPYHHNAVAVYPTTYASYPFDQYIDFLVIQGLVLRSGDEFRITVKGRIYLGYIVHAGKSLRRAL